MSCYFLATLHKSHCVRDAFKAKVTLNDTQKSTTELLLMFMDGKVEGWDLTTPFFRRVVQEELNLAQKAAFLIPNSKGNEDGILLLDSGRLYIVTISANRVVLRSELKLTGSTEPVISDMLLVPDKSNSSQFYFVMGTKTTQLRVARIGHEGSHASILNMFTVQLDSYEFDIFSSSGLVKEISHCFLIGLLSGKKESPSHLSLVEINPETRAVERNNELREVILKSREGSEVFDERIYKIVDVGNKCLIIFCSQSIKLFKVKDNSFQKITADKFKMPMSESILVERYPNKKNDNIIFLIASHVKASKTTFLYLMEIPSIANLNPDKISLTFLGNVPELSRPPIILDSKRLLLLSALDTTEIVDIVEAKTKNPQRPYLQVVQPFHNFGIIQQIEIDQSKKHLLVSSYKSKENIQAFQKGLTLESVSETRLDTTLLQKVLVINGAQYPSLMFCYADCSLIYHFGNGNQLYPETTTTFGECLLHFQLLRDELYLAASNSGIKVLQLWSNPQVVYDLPTNTDDEVLSADSFGPDIAFCTSKKLTFMHLNGTRLDSVKELALTEEPKFVKIIYHKVFVVYWLSDYIDSYSLNGGNHWRIQIQTPGVHSLAFFYSKIEECVILIGTISGTVVHKIYSKDGQEKSSQVLLVGKKPTSLREVNVNQFVAVSDESSMIYLSNNSTTIEMLPLCHPDLKDVFVFRYGSTEYYMLINKDSLGFSPVSNNHFDNYRLKQVKLDRSERVDRMITVGERIISSVTDEDTCTSQLAVHDMSTSKQECSVPISPGNVEWITHVVFQENSYILVGMSIEDFNEKSDSMKEENLTGRMKMYLMRGGELIELHDTQYDKPVRSIHVLKGGLHVLVQVGYSVLKVFKLEQKLKRLADRSVEITIPQLKEVHQQKFYFLIDTITVQDNYILLSDFFYMVQVILFENIRFPRFKSIGRVSSNLHEVMGCDLISPTSFVLSDRANNLMVMGLPESSNNEGDFTEYAEQCYICLNEQVLSFKQGSKAINVQFNDPYFEELGKSNKMPFVVLGGCSGGLYIMYKIPRATYRLLEDVQSAVLLQREGAESKLLKRKEYRKVQFKNRKSKNAYGFIDGDVLFSLLHMPDPQALEIIKMMKMVNKPSLSDIRNLLRFFENNPVN